MYYSDGNCVFYRHGEDTPELFLTVHPTRDCTRTTEEQAQTLADLCNGMGPSDE